MEKHGRIIKGIAGFYYVRTEDDSLYECKARGSFRNEKKKPLVGDYVTISILDEEKKTGSLDQIGERKNELIRPLVANVDQAIVIFAIKSPAPNFMLLDTFLARMELAGTDSIICFNKIDLDVDGSLQKEINEIYEPLYPVIFASTKTGEGVDVLKGYLQKKCSTVAGPSGVGKSSLINMLQARTQMETGGISQKTERGRHTTRHSELIEVEKDTYILDTPGFTSLRMDDFEKEEIEEGFREILRYKNCRFAGCSHIHEPDCSVREALLNGKISKSRYDSYVKMYEECKEKRRY